jgi:hypothetical protein
VAGAMVNETTNAPLRNRFLYKVTHWPLKDLMADETDGDINRCWISRLTLVLTDFFSD